MREHSMRGEVIRLAAEVIRLDGVTKSYQAGVAPALADVSMEVTAGEVAAVMGPRPAGRRAARRMNALWAGCAGVAWVP